MSLGLSKSIKQINTLKCPGTCEEKLDQRRIYQVRYVDGSFYEGPLENELQHGHGTFRFESGNIYRGSFVKGMREGYGEFFYSETGEYYKGYWKNDMKEGNGEYMFKDGSLFRGIFKNDLKHGFGEKIGSKIVYSGEYLNGQKHGIFRFKKNSTGEVKVVEYQHNQVVQRKENSKRNYVAKNIKKIKKSRQLKVSNKKQKITKKLKQLKISQTFCGNPLEQQQKNVKRIHLNVYKSNSPPKFRPRRYQYVSHLTAIKEVPETDYSVLSDESKDSFHFLGNEQSNSGRNFHLKKWKSGVNLLECKQFNHNLFRFENESAFKTLNLKNTSDSINNLEQASTIVGSGFENHIDSIIELKTKSNHFQ